MTGPQDLPDLLAVLMDHAAVLVPEFRLALLRPHGLAPREIGAGVMPMSDKRRVAEAAETGDGAWQAWSDGWARRLGPGSSAEGTTLYLSAARLKADAGAEALARLDSLLPGLLAAGAAAPPPTVVATRRIGPAALPERPDLVFRTDAAGQVTHANAALCRISGAGDCVPGLDALLGPAEAAGLRDRLADSLPEIDTVLAPLSPDGRVVRWMLAAIPGNGGVLAAGHDTTCDPDPLGGLMRRTLSAEHRNRVSTTLLENLGHEIRTPLNAVVGLAQVLRDAGLSADSTGKARMILAAGRQIAAILDGLGDARSERDDSDFTPAEVIGEVIALVRDTVDGSGQSLETRLASSTGIAVRGDRTRVQQVITNLIVNAIRHAGPAQITVLAGLDPPTQETAGLLTVSVSDTGRGIGTDLRETIFTRFARGDAGQDAPGSGLGLAISQEICELHGGGLRLEPTPGGGATFTASFSVDMPLGRPRFKAPAPPRPIPGALRILVAEDNKMNQEVLAAMLADMPVALTFADHGLAALEALRTARFDAVLVDMRMPVMDGAELATVIGELVAAGHLPEIPLIACSADPMRGRLPEFRKAGFRRALAKPIDQGELRACIDWIAEIKTEGS